MPNASGAIDLGTEPMPDIETPEPEESTKTALYAFAVIADTDGNVGAYPYEAEGVDPILDLNDDIVYGALATLQKDITAKTAAQATVQMQMAQAAAMQEQMARQQIAQGLDLRGGPRG